MAQDVHNDLRITDQFDFQAFWADYGKQISIALAVIALIGGAWFYRDYQASSEAEQAAAMLANARDTASLEQLIQAYPKSVTAAEALSRLADVYYRTGKYPEAASTYQKIISDFPSLPLAEAAKLGLAATLEAQGNMDGAKTQYMQIINAGPGSYVAPAAKMGLARCLEISGQKKEARQLYEEVLAQGQNSPWFSQAYLQWIVMSRDMPPEKPAEPAASAGAPTTSNGLQMPSLPPTH